MPESRVPERALDDPVGRKFRPLHVGRDGARTPMQWSSSRNGGFTEGDPWLPVDGSYRERNVAAESADPDSLLAWYRTLLTLRKSTPALHEGSYRALEAPRGVFAYLREMDGQRVVVALNFGNRRRTVRLPDIATSAGWQCLLSTHAEAGTHARSEIVLAPHEAAVFGEA